MGVAPLSFKKVLISTHPSAYDSLQFLLTSLTLDSVNLLNLCQPERYKEMVHCDFCLNFFD